MSTFFSLITAGFLPKNFLNMSRLLHHPNIKPETSSYFFFRPHPAEFRGYSRVCGLCPRVAGSPGPLTCKAVLSPLNCLLPSFSLSLSCLFMCGCEYVPPTPFSLFFLKKKSTSTDYTSIPNRAVFLPTKSFLSIVCILYNIVQSYLTYYFRK